jgi:hypothetical protein
MIVHSRTWLALAAGLALTGGLLAGCGSADSPAPAPSPTSTFSYALAAPEPATRCPKWPGSAHKVVVPSTDGVHLAGAEAGSGTRGLVLLHQADADLCGWGPYVADFVKAGFHVLAIDMRCNGLSDCSTAAGGDP